MPCQPRALLPLLLCLAVAALAQSQPAPDPATAFEVQKLADGVYATIRTKPPGLMVDANSVFILNDAGVIVVDANVTPSSARQVLAALRQLTDKPVTHVINTHWHDDHIMGNQVYREAFPGVEFVAHAATREYLPAQGITARTQMLTDGPPFLVHLKGLLEKGQNLAGEPMTPDERTAYAADIALADRFFAEVPGTPIVLPTLTLEDRLTLHRGRRTIEVRALGRGHTAGDIVVHLPQERILITGDLVVAPVPLIGAEQSHIADWAPSLDALIALQPALIVPGHGPVLRDDSYLKTLAAMMRSITEQTRAAVARGETLEQARQSVNLDQFRDTLAGDDRVRRLLFRSYVAFPAVAAAFREASSGK